MKIFFFFFRLNGQHYKMFTTQVILISELTKFFEFQEEDVLIEYNGRLYNPKIEPNKYIKNGDKIEIITIVGGG